MGTLNVVADGYVGMKAKPLPIFRGQSAGCGETIPFPEFGETMMTMMAMTTTTMTMTMTLGIDAVGCSYRRKMKEVDHRGPAAS